MLRGTGGNVGIFGRCIPCRAPLNNPGRFEDLRAASPGLNDRGNASLSASARGAPFLEIAEGAPRIELHHLGQNLIEVAQEAIILLARN